ncbi:MAG: hypothetical protein CL969_00105 [Euryarchaeota archaeon]|jgi:hypothetical protein|nr:hypothetical protein [Euryarchaeota archaeon]MDP6575332.1 hypothetical protein [Candidatus Peribacteraceae bacterium]HCI04116.1 hypothetical protein [Candidatus Peribacteria bacterium]|tara:strand:+ start:2935 stop:3165 length:231 start_codon:yes stop_codon:yes gene_type:complete
MRRGPDPHCIAEKAGGQVLAIEGVEGATFTPDILVVTTLPGVDTGEIKSQVEKLLADLVPHYPGQVVIETDDDLIQ